MGAYIIRRLLLVVPTLFLIILINFVVIQAAPGGPVEQALARIQGLAVDTTERIGGGSASDFAEVGEDISGENASQPSGIYRGAQGLPADYVEEIVTQFGFDKPAHERFWEMLGNYLTFDFGRSYFRDETVINLILEKMPVSITLGLWTTLLVYCISIPLGIRKAVRDGSQFDIWTSSLVIIGNAIPSFLFALLLVVVFAGGRYLDWFPLRGLTSDNYADLSLMGKIVDYFWHIALPVISMVIGGFAGLTMLTKNAFLDQISQQYVITARAKGLKDKRVLYGHVFRNAMLIVIAGFPAALLSILFTGALLIEIIFSLDGLGLLGFEALINRDYPILFANLYIFGLIGLVLGILNDVMYVIIDPRIDFDRRA